MLRYKSAGNGAAELSITLIAQWDGSGRYTIASTTRPVPADGLGTVLDALASLNSRVRGPKPGFEPSAEPGRGYVTRGEEPLPVTIVRRATTGPDRAFESFV